MPDRRLSARFARLAVIAAGLAVVIPSPVQASPGLVGTRHLGMGGASRASSRGTGAILVNPANMGFTRQFEIAPVYQANLETNTHGFGVLAMDSLLNERLALGLGYVAMVGGPKVSFEDNDGATQTLTMNHTGHEVGLPIAVNAVLGWLAFGVRPKFQHTALRFDDVDGKRLEARKTQNAFGLDVAMSFMIRGYASLSVIGYNLTGPTVPPTALNLAPYVFDPMTLDRRRVSVLSDYQRGLAHGFAVFPTRRPDFSLNFDGYYDFSSYRADKNFTRMVFAGGAEYSIAQMVPVRLGGYWDSRGRGGADDRGYIAAGVGYVRAPPKGGVGVDLGIGFSRQITGPSPETMLSVSLGLLLNPSR